MIKALHTAATGMAAQDKNVSTIANNISNANTNGFKKSRAEFDDLLYQTIKEPGARTSADSNHNVGIQIGSGAKVSATRKIHSPGNPIMTNNPFDLMIQGEGMFGVIMPNNEVRYTRNGSFNVNAQGVLVTKNDRPVFPSLSMPQGTVSVNITNDGNVEAYLKGQTEPQVVGQIPVFVFTNAAGLRSESENLYSATSASGGAIQLIAGQSNAGQIRQGALESSNVSIMTEMTDLIKAQRAFETNSKVMGVADQLMQTINQVTR